MGGISIWQLLIIALIVVLLFGTKKLRSLGGDLGGAVKGFKNAMSSDDDKKAIEDTSAQNTQADPKAQALIRSQSPRTKNRRNSLCSMVSALWSCCSSGYWGWSFSAPNVSR